MRRRVEERGSPCSNRDNESDLWVCSGRCKTSVRAYGLAPEESGISRTCTFPQAAPAKLSQSLAHSSTGKGAHEHHSVHICACHLPPCSPSWNVKHGRVVRPAWSKLQNLQFTDGQHRFEGESSFEGGVALSSNSQGSSPSAAITLCNSNDGY